jgi:hypothetical protein
MDLSLKELDHYCGTEQYYKLSHFAKTAPLGTDGIAYISRNGYGWLVDEIVMRVSAGSRPPFLVAKFDHTIKTLTIAEDFEGDKPLGRAIVKKFNYTDAERSLTIYITNDVMMLSGEY